MVMTLRQLAEKLSRHAAESPDDSPVLWQFISREHIAPNATAVEWAIFVSLYEDEFANTASELAHCFYHEPHNEELEAGRRFWTALVEVSTEAEVLAAVAGVPGALADIQDKLDNYVAAKAADKAAAKAAEAEALQAAAAKAAAKEGKE